MGYMKFLDSIYNAVEVVETEDGLLPLRFTKKQIDFYQNVSNDIYERAKCSAGVCFEFMTAALQVTFSYTVKSFPRGGVAFDVYEDDIFTQSVQAPDFTKNGVFTYKRNRVQKSKVCIYLPNTCEIYIKDIDFGAYETVPKKTGKKLLFFGDSITQGMESKYPSITYANLLARQCGGACLNQGVGGFVYNENALDENLAMQPDGIVVAYGTNDYFNIESVQEIEDNIKKYFAKLSTIYHDIPVNVVTPLWRADGCENEKFQKVVATIARYAKEHGHQVIYGEHLVPHQKEFFRDEYLHPNDLGFCMYAMALSRLLKTK